MSKETKDKFRAFLIGASMGLVYLYFKKKDKDNERQ